MFAKNKVSQSMIDAVNSIVNEAEKVPTPTGMRVYGSSYGNSEKARKDQLKSPVDDVEEPDEKQVTGKDKELQYKKTPSVSNTYKKHSGRYFSNMDVNKPSKGREEPRYKNEETEVAEELKGNQSKIDANHNGKIDGQDFKILRGKKKVKTEGMDFANKLLNSLQEKKNSPRNPRTDISRTGPKGKLPEEVEQIDEGVMDKMSLSALWHKHGHHHYVFDQGHGHGYGSSHHNDQAMTAIENHVRKHHGNKVADDMVHHSELRTAADEYLGGKDARNAESTATKLRAKHKIQGDMHGNLDEEVEHIEEKEGYSAKSARAGKDIGKPGKAFAKIAKGAAERYGSEEKGKKVAGAILAKLRKEEVELDEEQLDEMINEVLSKDATAGDWIHDFVHSDNPKFAGKSKAERKKMALGAYYAKNEEIEMKELSEEIVDLPINPLTGELEDDYELLVSGDAKELKKNQRMMIEEGTAQYKKKPSGKQMSDVVDRKKTVKDLVNRIRNPEYFGSGKVKGLDEVLQNADKPTSKEVRMATGIAKDKRYANGNMTGAAKVMDKIRPGLSQHPAAQAALRKANEAVETSNDKNASKITTDTLAGRVPGGKLNSFKNFKTNLTTNGTDSIPTEIEKGEDTKEKQKITTNPGPVEVKLDGKLTGPTPYTHFVKKDKVTTEEVRGELKRIRNKEKELQKKDVAKFAKELGEEVELLDEDKWLSRFLLSKGINPNFINRNQKVSHAKSGEFHKWKRDHQSIRGSIQGESVVTPIKHTENLATLALKKIKNETMMGKAGATSESKKKW